MKKLGLVLEGLTQALQQENDYFVYNQLTMLSRLLKDYDEETLSTIEYLTRLTPEVKEALQDRMPKLGATNE